MFDLMKSGSHNGSAYTPEMLTIIRMFERSEAPMALLNENLGVIWANEAATKLNRCLSMPDGVVQMLTSYTAEKALAQAGAMMPLTLISNPAMLTIYLTPLAGGYTANFSPYVSSGTALHPQGQQLLVSAISGQLRRPLSNVFSSVSSIRQFNLADEYPELEQFVNDINENAYKLLRTTMNISNYFKHFSPESEGNVVKLNLGDMLRNLLDAALMVTGESGVPISYTLPNEPTYISADESQLATAILQIISNSCHFKKEGSQIRVTLSKSDSGAIISIADSGLGIPESMLDKVFEPFFSFDHNGAPFAGVGLGLTIARSVIMQMGGRIAITSVENEGTTVAITLPITNGMEVNLRTPQPKLEYLRDRFSLLHVLLSDSCGCPLP